MRSSNNSKEVFHRYRGDHTVYKMYMDQIEREEIEEEHEIFGQKQIQH